MGAVSGREFHASYALAASALVVGVFVEHPGGVARGTPLPVPARAPVCHPSDWRSRPCAFLFLSLLSRFSLFFDFEHFYYQASVRGSLFFDVYILNSGLC